MSDCHSRRSGCSSSISTWGPADDIGSGSFLPPSLQESALIKISTLGPYFYYRFTQPVWGLSIKAQINVDGSWWWQRRFPVLAHRIANGWQSRLILLTIRSNLFRAKSSLKVSGGLTPYQQGVAAAVTLPPVAPYIIITHGWVTRAVAIQVMVCLQLVALLSTGVRAFIAAESTVAQETIGRLLKWFGKLASVVVSLNSLSMQSLKVTKLFWQRRSCNKFAVMRQHPTPPAIKNLVFMCFSYKGLCDWSLVWFKYFYYNIMWQLTILSLCLQHSY